MLTMFNIFPVPEALFFSAKFYAHLVLDRTSSGCTMSSKYLELWVTSFE